uniref:ATPase family AAA domain-containing protein n=1 Tax=Nymphaea colorata TaxID=210225 RepID=A0A5K1FJ80_9MAGN
MVPLPPSKLVVESRPAVEVGTSYGFDPESLERRAKALRDINSSPYAKQVFNIMRFKDGTMLN